MPVPYALYLLLVFVGIMFWLAAKLWPHAMAPFGRIAREVLSSLPSRIAIALIWWWLGWHFFTD